MKDVSESHEEVEMQNENKNNSFEFLVNILN